MTSDDCAAPRGEYDCLWCGRTLAGEPCGDEFVFVHDAVPHPSDATFDEDERPQ